jgi:pimeloyl-ACP methyl ester carboxylesterase
MMTTTWRRILIASLSMLAAASAPSGGQESRPLSEQQRRTIEAETEALGQSLATGHSQTAGERLADAAIFHKGLVWALAYDREFSPADVALLEKALARGRQRAELQAAGKKPWTERRGKVALGYVSRVDGSVQPYGVIVPKDYDPSRTIRLDVVLHGSTRPVGLSELRFIDRFDDGDDESKSPPDQPFIELHPLGRVENCYRWAGETDVFDAIEDVCRRYAINRDRIVLRGMSMGASGTWHLGLKHPDRFVALGPYCGYVDTHHFSETPLANFVKVGPLPEHQELGLHMLDSIDYAANARVVPAIACMGEKDVFFQAHVLMGEAMEREGLKLVNLISPGTGHVIDPVTHAEQMRQIGELAARGIDHQPRELKFVTWTLKYGRCHWLEVLGMERHYARAELSARRSGDLIDIDEPKNVTRFAIRTASLPAVPKKLHVGGTELSIPDSITPQSPGVVVTREGGRWQIAGQLGNVALTGKRPGLQGPIDDAFTSPFLCVRGTGRTWNADVGAYADAALERSAKEWHHYFRGELPIKDDTAVTDEDVRTKNLILFGDGGSNAWIAKVLPHLPIAWSQESLRVGDQEYPAGRHLPALIAPSPLPGGEAHYVVLNSGHTFRETELAKLNYLLFPRWGDWAVLEIDPHQTAAGALEEKVLRAGFCDEQWRIH